MKEFNPDIIVDSTNSPIGRVASFAAKQALLGKSIAIVNCKNSIVSGTRSSILEKYRTGRERGKGWNNAGPHFPKSAERLMKRTVRGMLSYKQGRGDAAFKKIICFNEIPNNLLNKEKISFAKKFKIKTTKLNEVSKEL